MEQHPDPNRYGHNPLVDKGYGPNPFPPMLQSANPVSRIDRAVPKQQYITPGGYKRAREGVMTAMFMPIMVCLYRVWIERNNGDRLATTGKVADLIMCWKIWVVSVMSGAIASFLAVVDAGPDNPHSIETTTGWLGLCAFSFVASVLVVYNKLIDRSGFRRRFAYRLIRPFQLALGWIPWPVLSTMCLLPWLWGVRDYV